MNDGYFEEPKRNRGGGWKYAIVALVSLLVGALIMVAFAPSLLAMFGGSLTGEQGGQATRLRRIWAAKRPASTRATRWWISTKTWGRRWCW